MMSAAAAAAAAALPLGAPPPAKRLAAAVAARVCACVSRQKRSILNWARHSWLQNWSCVSLSMMLTHLLPSASFSSLCGLFPWHQSQDLLAKQVE